MSVRNGLFASRPTDGPHGTRILRISAVRDGRVDLRDSKFVTGLSADKVAQFALSEGDLLFTRYNGSRHLVGICGLVPRQTHPVIHPDKLIRVVTDHGLVDPKFLNLQMESPIVRQYLEPRIRTTAGQSGLSGKDIRGIPVSLPSLVKQRLIVKILEANLSRLEASERYFEDVSQKSRILLASALYSLFHPESASRVVQLSEVAEVRLGRQRSPKNHSGDRMRPYLRAANVGWGEFNLEDVKQMQFSASEEATYTLLSGDILLTEASGSPSEVGKSAICGDQVAGLCIQNTLLRVRCFGADPSFVHLALLSDALTGRFRPNSRGVGINHLGKARLASWQLRLPSAEEQRKRARAGSDLREQLKALEEEVDRARKRNYRLRSAILTAAFSGLLTGSDSDRIEEMADV